ncbi:MAG TPA: hypothetical protein VK983_05130 [Candidatus Limnocylindrales bacterium]|nr:hypothetical protein [Candidatus Limnocylindrales bacterium]
MIFDNGDTDPATQPGYDTYLGVSVAKDRIYRDRWNMHITLRTIPLQDEDWQPTAEDPEVTTWEQYAFDWRRDEELCREAVLREKVYEHMVIDNEHVIVGLPGTIRPLGQGDCWKLCDKLVRVAEVVSMSPEDELAQIHRLALRDKS